MKKNIFLVIFLFITVSLFSSELSIKTGWNLISNPVDKTYSVNQFKDAQTVWSWENNSWKIWTNIDNLKDLMAQYGIKSFENLIPGKGYWVNTNSAFSVNFTGNEYGVEKFNTVNGWNLLGYGKSIEINKFNIPSFKINSLWKWANNKWEIYSPLESINKLIQQYNIPVVKVINQGEGFWVNGNKSSFELYSNSFSNNGYIPDKYTCNGENISPSLYWKNIPSGTKSFVIIVDDPDAPTDKPWVHWIVYNISSSIDQLKEGIDVDEIGAINGKNSWNQNNIGYRGPCPPDDGKVHHYHFKIYAVDIATNFNQGLTKEEILNKIQGHILGEAEIVGLYKFEKEEQGELWNNAENLFYVSGDKQLIMISPDNPENRVKLVDNFNPKNSFINEKNFNGAYYPYSIIYIQDGKIYELKLADLSIRQISSESNIESFGYEKTYYITYSNPNNTAFFVYDSKNNKKLIFVNMDKTQNGIEVDKNYKILSPIYGSNIDKSMLTNPKATDIIGWLIVNLTTSYIEKCSKDFGKCENLTKFEKLPNYYSNVLFGTNEDLTLYLINANNKFYYYDAVNDKFNEIQNITGKVTSFRNPKDNEAIYFVVDNKYFYKYIFFSHELVKLYEKTDNNPISDMTLMDNYIVFLREPNWNSGENTEKIKLMRLLKNGGTPEVLYEFGEGFIRSTYKDYILLGFFEEIEGKWISYIGVFDTKDNAVKKFKELKYLGLLSKKGYMYEINSDTIILFKTKDNKLVGYTFDRLINNEQPIIVGDYPNYEYRSIFKNGYGFILKMENSDNYKKYLFYGNGIQVNSLRELGEGKLVGDSW